MGVRFLINLYLALGHEVPTDTTISGRNVFLTAQDGSIINNDTLNNVGLPVPTSAGP